MTPTQQRDELRRMSVKIQTLERGAVDEARALNAQRQGNVAFCLEILDALGLRMAVRDGMREEIHAEIKRLKAIEAAGDALESEWTRQLSEEVMRPCGGIDSVCSAIQHIWEGEVDLQECANLLPDSRYMDPPDGGSPTIAVQLQRMIAELNAEVKRLKAIESAVNGE